MKTKLSNKLQQQVLLGSITLLIVFFVIASIQWHALHDAKRQAIYFSRITQLQQQVSHVLDRSQYYKENAPRDFESYNRDVDLFYNDIVKQIVNLDKGFNAIWNSDEQPLGDSIVFAFSKNIKMDLDKGDFLLEKWSALVSEFNVALGDDIKNPRLEWGSDTLITKLPYFIDDLAQWLEQYHLIQEHKAAFLKKVIIVLLSVATFLSLSGIFWVYQKLLKRVGKTAIACKRVADGEYGYQIQNKHNDEIGQLIEAFNYLSCRTQAVLAMVDQVAHAQSNQQLLASISDQQQLMKSSWMGLMLMSKDKSTLDLVATTNEKDLKSWNFKNILLNKGKFGTLVDSSLNSNESLVISDASLLSVEDPHARFIRTMTMQTSCNSLAVVPIVSSGRSLGVLVLGCKEKNECNKEDLQLLENLNELIGSRLYLLNKDNTNNEGVGLPLKVSA